MHLPSASSTGQAVYIRTDSPDYAEESIPFHTLEELIRLGTTPRPHRILDKIVLQGLHDQSQVTVTLLFLAASHGQRPPSPTRAP